MAGLGLIVFVAVLQSMDLLTLHTTNPRLHGHQFADRLFCAETVQQLSHPSSKQTSRLGVSSAPPKDCAVSSTHYDTTLHPLLGRTMQTGFAHSNSSQQGRLGRVAMDPQFCGEALVQDKVDNALVSERASKVGNLTRLMCRMWSFLRWDASSNVFASSWSRRRQDCLSCAVLVASNRLLLGGVFISPVPSIVGLGWLLDDILPYNFRHRKLLYNFEKQNLLESQVTTEGILVGQTVSDRYRV